MMAKSPGQLKMISSWLPAEKLARYIIRASCSQERLQYLADAGTVIYSAKDGKSRKVFDTPEWLAAMCPHVPNRGRQMVRYYGWYSNVTRGEKTEGSRRGRRPFNRSGDPQSLLLKWFQ